MRKEKIEKGTIYFPKLKKRGKIKIKGKVTNVKNKIDSNHGHYVTLTLKTIDGDKEFNYFKSRIIVEGTIISGEGMYYSDKCKYLRTFRTLKEESK